MLTHDDVATANGLIAQRTAIERSMRAVQRSSSFRLALRQQTKGLGAQDTGDADVDFDDATRATLVGHFEAQISAIDGKLAALGVAAPAAKAKAA